MLTWEDLYQSK